MDTIINEESHGRVSGLCFSTSATALTVGITTPYPCASGRERGVARFVRSRPDAHGHNCNLFECWTRIAGKIDDAETTSSSAESIACRVAVAGFLVAGSPSARGPAVPR